MKKIFQHTNRTIRHYFAIVALILMFVLSSCFIYVPRTNAEMSASTAAQATFSSAWRQKVGQLADRTDQSFTHHQLVLEKLIARTDARLQRMKTAGKDTTRAESDLISAKKDLDIAVRYGEDASSQLRNFSNQDHPPNKNQKIELRDSLLAAQKTFLQVTQDLHELLRALKNAS